MSLYTTLRDCNTGGVYYREGQIVSFASAPDVELFAPAEPDAAVILNSMYGVVRDAELSANRWSPAPCFRPWRKRRPSALPAHSPCLSIACVWWRSAISGRSIPAPTTASARTRPGRSKAGPCSATCPRPCPCATYGARKNAEFFCLDRRESFSGRATTPNGKISFFRGPLPLP